MRRSLFVVAVLALLLLGALQSVSQATPQGGGTETYMPVVMKMATFTPTPQPEVGNGIFKRELLTYYPEYTGTKSFGFVRFFSGEPAFGGPNNFHVWVCFTGGQGCYRSTDLDSTGYYDVNINGAPAAPIKAPGVAYVTKGPFGSEIKVSQDFPFDTTNGSCWRMDWIECGTNSTEPACQGPTTQLYAELTQLPAAPDGTCPPS